MNQGPIIHKRIIGRTFLGICQPSYHNFQEKKGCKFHAHLEVFFSLNLMTLYMQRISLIFWTQKVNIRSLRNQKNEGSLFFHLDNGH